MLGALNAAETEQILHTEVIGRIGCYAEGKVYVVPITYCYDGECIIGHSGTGMKIDMMRKNPDVCFEVDHMENMANWQSVIAWGKFEELEGEDAMAAMQKLMSRLAPLITSSTSTPSHELPQSHARDRGQKKAVIYQIRLHEKTGRFEKR